MVPGWLLDRQPSGNALLAYVHLAKRGTWNPGTGTYDECRPSMGTLGADMKGSEDKARRGVRELIELGAVKRRQRFDANGGELPAMYQVIFGTVVGPPVLPEGGSQICDGGGSQKRDGGGSKSATTPVANLRHNQEPLNQEPLNQEKHSRASRSKSATAAAADSFEEWYAAYPIKRDRGAAAKAYTKALTKAAGDRRVKSGDLTAVELLLAAAASYRDDPNRDPGFTKYPATWLNRECWLDERLPERRPTAVAGGMNELIEVDGMQLTRRNADALARMRRLPVAECAQSVLALEGAPW